MNAHSGSVVGAKFGNQRAKVKTRITLINCCIREYHWIISFEALKPISGLYP
jgi:hypothetical protein